MEKSRNVYCLDLIHNNGERIFKLVMAESSRKAIAYIYSKLPPWIYVYHVEELSEDKVSVYRLHHPIEKAN